MMRLEVVRIVAEALRHATRGVNSKLPDVPRDAGDDLPSNIAAVYDVTKDAHVVNRQEPPQIPCLYVMSEGAVIIDGEQMIGTYRDTTEPVAVVVRYLASKHDLARALQDGDYTLRAVARSIHDLMEQANDADRTRNFVIVWHLVRMTYVPVQETVGEAAVAGALVLEFDVRDGAPLTNPS